jgi:hypothetical protein
MAMSATVTMIQRERDVERTLGLLAVQRLRR